jgi:hypothetical protein
MPEAKPARKPFYELGDDGARVAQNKLVMWLNRLRPNGQSRAIRFSDDSLRILDETIARVEAHGTAMTARLPTMALKLAMLSAIGQPFRLSGASPDFTVTEEDARCALSVLKRWEAYALEFEKRLGESEVERHVKRTIALFRHLNKKRRPEEQQTAMKVTRRTVARHLHVTSKVMEDVERVLEDRGVIERLDGKNRRRDSAIWVWEGHTGEEQGL